MRASGVPHRAPQACMSKLQRTHAWVAPPVVATCYSPSGSNQCGAGWGPSTSSCTSTAWIGHGFGRHNVTRVRATSLSSEGGTQARPKVEQQQPQQPSSTGPGSGWGSASATVSSSASSTGNRQQSASNGPGTGPPQLAAVLQASPALGRKLVAAESGMEAIELLLSERPDLQLTTADLELLIIAALDSGNVSLALSIHESMVQAGRRVAVGVSAVMRTGAGTAGSTQFAWPPADLDTTCSVVLGLTRQLAIDEALNVLSEIRAQGLPRNDAVGFGKVISSPLAPNQTLTVVQPQEGLKLVADAYSRYEYELFSGKVLNVKSEALQISTSLLLAALRAVGILRRAPPAAIHEFTVQAPDGVSRTFRVATPSADVPAQVGERVTFVCAPSPATARSPNRKRQTGLFSSSPPDTTPGEALTATNHVTGVVTKLLPPPLSSSQATIPGWVLPVAVLAAGGDAASSLIDPQLPLLITASAAGVMGSAVAGNKILLPRLKQLPERSVEVEYTRQRLLGQYAQLASKAELVMAESAEDVRMLARLVQLTNKMSSLGSGAAGQYAARMERVAAAAASIETRLAKKMELLDGYARVMNMIEIEVEMELQVPAAELEGIEQQMERLNELEGLTDEWRLQAEARDEVERLLRAP